MVSICPLLWQRDVKLQQTKSSDKLVTSFVNPPCFSSAATKYGIDTEPLARGRYIDIKNELDPVISVTTAGFVID